MSAAPKFTAALSTTLVTVKAKQGQVSAYEFTNTGNAIAYVQFFDALAADVTLGTTAPVWVVPVPAGGRAAGPQDAIRFNTGIVVAATSTATGSSAANQPQVSSIGFR